MKTRWFIKSLLLYLVIGCTTENENLITSYGVLADGQTNNAALI